MISPSISPPNRQAQACFKPNRMNSERPGGKAASRLDGVTLGLPGLTRAVKLQKRAAEVGFDWPDHRQVLAKLREELGELEAELDDPASDQERREEELGDLLFVVANLARHVDADPEACLAAASAKFERRFKGIEDRLDAEGRKAQDATLDELEALWQSVKRQEKAGA